MTILLVKEKKQKEISVFFLVTSCFSAVDFFSLVFFSPRMCFGAVGAGVPVINAVSL